ncbi:hypothetical protein QL285_008191 [Trifolium repens]|nr:hypothetical protein QL285_008191 [Trifolium repens]
MLQNPEHYHCCAELIKSILVVMLQNPEHYHCCAELVKNILVVMLQNPEHYRRCAEFVQKFWSSEEFVQSILVVVQNSSRAFCLLCNVTFPLNGFKMREKYRV